MRSQTYNSDKQVPDSAGTATAIFSGVKCKYSVLGFDAKAQTGTCDEKLNEISKVTTVADWAQQSGMDTGKSLNIFLVFHSFLRESLVKECSRFLMRFSLLFFYNLFP